MVIFSDVGYPVRRVQDKGGKQVLRCDISTSEGGGGQGTAATGQ